MSNAKFLQDLMKINQHITELPAKAAAKLGNKVLNGVVMKTPRDEGTAQGNWNISAGTPDKSFNPSNTEPPLPSLTYTKLLNDPIVYVTNNTPWIGSLEFGTYQNPNKEHWSKKPIGTVLRSTTGGYYVIRTESSGFSNRAPNGMARITMEEMKDYVSKPWI